MSDETAASAASNEDSAAATVVVAMGGAYDYYPAPQVLLAATLEVLQRVSRSLKSFGEIPAATEGSFLRPPQASHFGREA